MSHNNGLIVTPINVASDIGEVLGTGSGDVGTNCTCSNITVFTKYKPNNLVGWGEPSEAKMRNNRFALWGHAVTDLSILPTVALQGWTYKGANASVGQKYYRVLDFKNYYHNAPCPFMQANGTLINFDLLDNTAPSVLFYLLMANGRYANCAFSTTSGINKHGTPPVPTTPTNLIPYCICIDPSVSGTASDDTLSNIPDYGLSFELPGNAGSYISGGLINAYCGVVIYTKLGNTYTYKTELFANEAAGDNGDYPIKNNYTQDENNMFIISLAKLLDKTGSERIFPGTYYIVPCAKKTIDTFNYYMPVYNHINYPAIVELKIGLDNYKQEIISYDRLPLDGDDEVSITMRFYNNSSHTVTFSDNSADRDKIKLYATINTVGDSWIYINGVADHQITNEVKLGNLVNATYPIIVNANSYVDLTYKISRIWYIGTPTQAVRIDSGSITIAPVIKYGADFTYGWHPESSVRNFTWTY